MDSKTMLEGILWDLKELSDLGLHGTIESGTSKVHKAFLDTLNTTLEMQDNLFQLMSEEGYYCPSKADQNKICQVKDCYNPTLKDN